MNKLAVVLVLILAGSATSLANEGGDADGAPGYAEGVYADYAANSDTDVRFAVETVGAGSLRKLAGTTLESLVGAPTHHVEADDGAVSVSHVRFAPFDQNKVDYAELGGLVDAFDGAGYPVADGAFRLLDIAVTIGGESRRHRAAEFCWAAQQHCVVFDPTIAFLDSIVENHRVRKAAGWSPQVAYEASPDTKAVSAVCGLASAPWAIARWTTWGSYQIDYKNYYNQVIIRKYMGSQQAGVRCDASCRVSPFGYSDTSSVQTFGGGTAYSVDCGNLAVSGVSGNTAKFEAETKCSHRLAFSARADASANGYGLGIDIKWDTQGSVDSNGGQRIETCGYY